MKNNVGVILVKVDYEDGNTGSYKGICASSGGTELKRIQSDDFARDYEELHAHLDKTYPDALVMHSSSVGHFANDLENQSEND